MNTPDFSFFCDATEQINHIIKRKLTIRFGDVTVKRKSYSQLLHNSVFPLDAQLNLPADQYFVGIRQRVALEAKS